MKILAILMMVFAFAIPLHAGIDAKGKVTAESITLGTNVPITTWMDAVSEGGGITNGSTNVDFGSLFVAANATNGTEAVNWQTMTGYVGSAAGMASWSSYPATNTVKLTNAAIAYEDMLASATAAYQSGGSDISNNDALGGKAYATTATTNIANDHLTFVYQTPHRRKSNTHIDPHLHFWQTNADQTNCWFMTYTWAALGATNYTELGPFGPASNVLVYASGTMHQLASFPEIVNTNSGVSGILRIKLYRFGLRGTGAITVTDLDCHYEVDGFGSDQELTKSY